MLNEFWLLFFFARYKNIVNSELLPQPQGGFQKASAVRFSTLVVD